MAFSQQGLPCYLVTCITSSLFQLLRKKREPPLELQKRRVQSKQKQCFTVSVKLHPSQPKNLVLSQVLRAPPVALLSHLPRTSICGLQEETGRGLFVQLSLCGLLAWLSSDLCQGSFRSQPLHGVTGRSLKSSVCPIPDADWVPP